jgi:hypothetical protein
LRKYTYGGIKRAPRRPHTSPTTDSSMKSDKFPAAVI